MNLDDAKLIFGYTLQIWPIERLKQALRYGERQPYLLTGAMVGEVPDSQCLA